MFRVRDGIAVALLTRRFEQRLSGGALSSALAGRAMLQNLPSIVAARALAPPPGSRVLDMCASPGGKTSALAALMGNVGELVALDVNATKVGHLRALCAEMGATCVTCHRLDATRAVIGPAAAPHAGTIRDAGDCGVAKGAAKVAERRTRKMAGARSRGQPLPETPVAEPAGAPFPGESFDAILLDAPCSALGLRPRLSQPVTARELQRAASYQRSLLHVAAALLRPGGALVFSTCSISPLENEANVGWALAAFPQLRLAPCEPQLGGPGLTGAADGSVEWLTAEQAAMVQRFDPAGPADTIGFFVARFVKAG